MKILVIDVGGSAIKLLATGHRTPVKIPSGPRMTPARMVKLVRDAVKDWDYSVISVGYPGPVRRGRVMKEPKNLGRGWMKFDFRKAFGRPVRVINDAAMQALGSYHGGRMLFLGLGTGLGSAMIVDDVMVPMELAHLPFKKGRTYEQHVGRAALETCGKKRWRKRVEDITSRLKAALEVDEVVLGGGNAKYLERLPAGVRLGRNVQAFAGGYRLWNDVASTTARRRK